MANISPLKLQAAIVAALPAYGFVSEYPNQPGVLEGGNVISTIAATVIPSNPQPYRSVVRFSTYAQSRYACEATVENLVDELQTVSLQMVGQAATSWSETFRSAVQWDGGILAFYQYVEIDFAIRVD